MGRSVQRQSGHGSSGASGAAVRLAGVEKVYRRGERVRVLEGVWLTIPSGSYTAIMGPSGSGKTTLLNLVGGLDTPTSGRLSIDEYELDAMTEPERAALRGRVIGFVSQSFNLLPRLTARENVALPLVVADVSRPARRGRATAALDRLGLADRADHRPRPNSRGGSASGWGSPARWSANRGSSSSTSRRANLDATTGERTMTAIDALREDGTMIVLVTHDRAGARRANRPSAGRARLVDRTTRGGPRVAPCGPSGFSDSRGAPSARTGSGRR